MPMFLNLVCPMSNERIDRNAVRISGIVTTLCLAAYVVTRSPFIIFPVALDYLLRTVLTAPPSPMTRLARGAAKQFRLPERMMDKAPKVFASRIGACLATGAAITHLAAPGAAPWLAGALACFTLLEGAFDLCVGCVAYTYMVLPLSRARRETA